MESSNFATPLETVKLISIFSYFSTLSDFLFENGYLSQENLNKQIPVVNSLYEFLETQNNTKKKEELVRQLLSGSDLFGEKENETLSPNFVNKMFEYIVSSLVFDQYGNIYGFIVHTLISTNNITISHLIKNMNTSLQEMTFQNEDGSESVLSKLSAKRIFNELILSLFPRSERNWSIRSIDFIYAHAGLRFLSMSQEKFVFYNDSADNIFKQQIFQNVSDKKTIDELVGIGLAIEQLVVAVQLNKFALSVFALPAILLYAYSQRDSFENNTVDDIVTDPDEWANAHNLLFSFLQELFKAIHHQVRMDERYQFQKALHNFKKYSTFAQAEIEKGLSMSEMILDERPLNARSSASYKYDIQCQEISRKYYELQLSILMKDAFSENFVNSIKQTKVIIYEAKIKCENENLDCMQKTDVFQFYFPDNDTAEYYALISKDEYEVEFIKESEDPNKFRQKLGVSDVDFQRKENITMKNENDSWMHFLSILVERKTNLFKNILFYIGRPEKKGNWWQENGPVWTPFYYCIIDVMQKEKVSNFCLLDTIFAASTLMEETEISSKIISQSTNSMLAIEGTNIKTVILRDYIQRYLSFENDTRTEELAKAIEIGIKTIMHELGHSIYRLLDSGYELSFIIGRQGIEKLNDLVMAIGDKIISSFNSFKESYEKIKNALKSHIRKIGEISYSNVYVKSLGDEINSSYGYKFIKVNNGRIAQLRSVLEFPEQQVPIVTYQNRDIDIHKYFNVEDGIEEDIYVRLGNEDTIRNSQSAVYKLQIKSYDPVNVCKLIERNAVIDAPCPRARRLKIKRERVKAALSLPIPESKVKEVRNILSAYYFPDDENREGTVVKDLIQPKRPNFFPSQIKLYYEIIEPEIFFNLKYNLQLDSMLIAKNDAEKRINSLYTATERSEIENGVTIDALTRQYFQHRLYESLTFEDFYAIRNYELGGYRRITRNTKEANLMKIALYKLAIRQCDDPDEEFESILHREDTVPKKFVDGLSSGGILILKQFTSVANYFLASRIKSKDNRVRIVYDIKFPKRYLRAKLNEFLYVQGSKSILLPGTVFNIEDVREENLFSNYQYYRIVLRLNNDTYPIIECQQNVMKKIEKMLVNNQNYKNLQHCTASNMCISFFDD